MFKALGYHTFAKIVVVLAAYILHFCLGKILSRAEYGIVGTIISFCNFYYMFLTNGVRQGISKLLSLNKFKNIDVIKKGIFLQTVFSLALAALNYALAPILGAALGDPAFETYIKLISILIPLTAIYFAFTGGLNGAKLFFSEAIVTMVYPILRLSAVPLAQFMPEDSTAGVILGFSLASLLSALLAAALLLSNSRFRSKQDHCEELPNKQMLQASVEFIISFAAITLILNMDTFFLQYVNKDTALTGLYTGVCTFSLVPYYLISAFYLVILPYITENYSKGDLKNVKKIIADNFNIIMMFVLPITGLISISAPELLSCFYNPEYYQAGSALTLLAFGTFLLSIFAVFCVILNGMNSRHITKSLSVCTVGLDLILLYTLIPRLGLIGAAASTTISAFAGCLIALIYVVKKIGNPFDLKTMVKCACLTGVFMIACRIILNHVKISHLLILIVYYAFLAILYLACMVLLKIIDIKKLKRKINK